MICMNFDSVEKYPIQLKEGDLRLLYIENPVEFFKVKKMRFADKSKETVIYNSNLTIQNIPIEAYDYQISGRSALEWVMERQAIKTDKKSGIINDPNDYANNIIENPAYPLELFQRIITVSLETNRIVNSIPPLGL